MRILGVAVAMLLLMATYVCAETERQLEVGARLRIRTTEATAEYVLEGIGEDGLTVLGRNDSEPQHIAFEQVQRVDMRVARSPGAGALWGAAIGGGIAGAVGAVYAIATWGDVDVECGPYDKECSDTAAAARLIGAVGIFGMGGALVGGIVGAASPGGTWQPVDLPGNLSIGLDDDNALSVQFSLAF